MSPLFLARRRAERFDSMVEGGRRDDVDRSTSDLLELVSALRSAPEPRARPEFVADLRERLMTAAATELVTTTPTRERDAVERLTIKPARTRRERRVGIALGAVAILGATTSMAVASQGAIPGDVLYPVKRAIENTQAGFSVGDDAKGGTILGNASGRLDEVDELAHQSQPNAELVTETLDNFSSQAAEAGDLLMSDYEQHGHEQSIEQVHAFTDQSIGALSELEAVIPPEAHDALLNAAQVVLTLDAAAQNVCPDCGEGVTEVPSQLLAGAASALTGATDSLAGGQLPGTDPPSAGSPGVDQPQDNGDKVHELPSGLNPPETPIQLPPPSSDATGLGGLLGGATGTTGGGTGTSGAGTGTTGGSTGGNGGNGGGKGGKHHPVDLAPVTAPVTETVDEVVTGVVEGVTGLLNGLTGH
jgi:uncharacterized protein DUF5667